MYDFYAGKYCKDSVFKTLNSVQRKVLEIVWMLQCSHGEQSIIFMFIIQKHNGIMSDIQHHHSNNVSNNLLQSSMINVQAIFDNKIQVDASHQHRLKCIKVKSLIDKNVTADVKICRHSTQTAQHDRVSYILTNLKRICNKLILKNLSKVKLTFIVY